MRIWEVLLLAVGLSMDAFAVSVCKGLALPQINWKNTTVCGIWFGGFQALMPLVGFLLGGRFTTYISTYTPWIAFILLSLIGGNMIKEALQKEEDVELDANLDGKTMLVLAIATSIDALAVGVTFACVPVEIMQSAGALFNTILAVIIIGIITFMLSCAGVRIGNLFGSRYEKKAELAGGIILLFLGIKILLR